jgi:hypothetical protein
MRLHKLLIAPFLGGAYGPDNYFPEVQGASPVDICMGLRYLTWKGMSRIIDKALR